MEYENILNALNLSLCQNKKVFDFISVLNEYFKLHNNYKDGLKVWQDVKGRLLKYPVECREKDYYSDLANTYFYTGQYNLRLQNYMQAKENYVKSIEIFEKNEDWSNQAVTYHQLGYVAGEAKENYKKALEIIVQYNDEYNVEIIVNSMFRLNEAIGDDNVLDDVQNVLGISKEEVLEVYNNYKDNKKGADE